MFSSSVKESASFYRYPLISQKKQEKKEKDWLWISAIVAAVIGGLIAALAAVCIMDIFPTAVLGGTLGTGITLIVGLSILLPAAYILFDKWWNPDQPE